MSTLISENDPLVFQKASIINPDIEFVGIINSRGKMVDSIGKDIINMPNGKKEMFFMKIALRNSMQKDFDEDLGNVTYCMTQRGSSKYISIPFPNGNTVLVVAKKDANPDDVVAGINQILHHSSHFLGETLSKEEDSIN